MSVIFLTKSKRTFLFVIILMSPIFINLNVGAGLRFDANPFNYLGAPSLPVSLFLVLILGLSKISRLRMPIQVYFFLILSSIYLIGGALYGGGRSLILFVSMSAPILNYYIMREHFTYSTKNTSPVSTIYIAMSILILSKFILDVSLYGSLYSEYFIFKWVVIYSYYDYFPFLYFVGILLALDCLINGDKKLLSILMIAVCFVCIFSGHSRLYMALSLFSVPLLLFFNIARIRVYDAGVASMLFVLIVTLCVALNDTKGTDNSFSERFHHWQEFIGFFDWEDLFVPFSNEYRRSLAAGSFHNEFLEIFSYFGLVVLLYFFILLVIFRSVDTVYRAISITILVSLIFGSLIQLNFTNPYLGIVWSTILAAMSNRAGGQNLGLVRLK
ncbi:MAG: hypothetical protein RPT25_15460 [Cycloclasticus sp.]